jgi:AcrR family transcriptional regulator
MLAGTNKKRNPPRKARLSSQERKRLIVKAAIRLFSEHGFRGTTTRELAAAAGVTEPVLYQHFETKRDLYSALIESKSMEGQERVDAVLGPHLTNTDDRVFFTRLAELILECYTDDPAYIRLLLFSALERHELADLFYERELVGFYKIIADYIRRRIRQRAFRRMDASLAARAFVGMVADHGLCHLLFNDAIVKLSQKELIGGMVKIFLQGVSRKRRRMR